VTAEQAAREFQARLVAGLAEKATNADFARVGELLRSLTRAEEAQACLRRYLDVYAKQETERNRSRSLAAFYLAVRRVVELAKPGELDAWRQALTAAKGALRERFDALEQGDRNRILELVNAPKQARKQSASVLDELRDAFHRAEGRDARDLTELAEFDPLNDPGLVRDYRDRVAKLQQAFALAKRPRERGPVDTLRLEVDATWAWLLGQRRDGLRLFQLLRVWRADRGDAHIRHPSSWAEEVTYVQIAAALLSYAVSTKAYAANVRAKGFTAEEWRLVLAPLDRLEYASTYRNQLKRFFDDVPSFPRQCELFLRLLAFASSTGSWLATDDELRTVTRKLDEASAGELRKRSFTVGANVATRWYVKGDYRIGQQIGTKLVIVYFEGERPERVYVEFAGMRGALFAVPFSRFVGYAEDAPYDLIYEATKGLLVLIPVLFEVLVAIPVVVEGGFIGLVQALLQPAEEKVAADVLDAFGFDPDKAGWLVVGANLLLAHKVGQLGKPELRGFEELEAAEGRFGRAIERPGTSTRAIEPPDPVPPRATGKPLGTEVRAIEASEVPERQLVKALERPQTGEARMLKAAERDADKSAAKASRTRQSQQRRKAVGDDSDPKAYKGKSNRGTGNRGTGSRGTPPPPPPPPPVTPSPLGYLSVGVERSTPFAALRRAGWKITREPFAGNGKGLWAWWQRRVSGVEHEWKLVSPSGVEVSLDGLALEAPGARRLSILEAKAGYTDVVTDSAHFRFSDSKAAQLTRQLSTVLESDGVIDKVIVVCNRRAAAETYQNIAQNLVADLRRNFAPQLRAWLARETQVPVKRLLTKDIERFIEEHFDVVWQ
jgi:hypothetical protein